MTRHHSVQFVDDFARKCRGIVNQIPTSTMSLGEERKRAALM
jgi:hypothetical protein